MNTQAEPAEHVPARAGLGIGQNWKRIADFTANDREVIRERHFGWEKATPALLADIFLTTPQTITAILRGGQ